MGGGERKEETSMKANDGKGGSGQKMGPEIVVSPPSPEKGEENGAAVWKEPKVGQAAARKEKPTAESPKLGAASDKRAQEGNLYVDDDREIKDGFQNKPFESE